MNAAKLLRAGERKTDSKTDQKRTLGKQLTGRFRSDEKEEQGGEMQGVTLDDNHP
jgi:hypothetical protein